jgi:hypothetical protein
MMTHRPYPGAIDAYLRSGLQGVLLLAVIAVTVGILLEVRAWVRGTRLIGIHQKAYRLTAAGLMNAVLLMVLYNSVFGLRQDWLFQLGYWGLTICLAFALVLVAMLDVRATLISYREQRHKAFKDVFGEERRKE